MWFFLEIESLPRPCLCTRNVSLFNVVDPSDLQLVGHIACQQLSWLNIFNFFDWSIQGNADNFIANVDDDTLRALLCFDFGQKPVLVIFVVYVDAVILLLNDDLAFLNLE